MKRIMKLLVTGFSKTTGSSLHKEPSIYEADRVSSRMSYRESYRESGRQVNIFLPPYYCDDVESERDAEDEVVPRHVSNPSPDYLTCASSVYSDYRNHSEEELSDDESFTSVQSDVESDVSREPEYRVQYLLDVAEDMIRLALEKVEEYEDILDIEQLEELEHAGEKLDDFRARLDIFYRDSAISRLVRVELYSTEAAEFLNRVLVMIDAYENAQT